MEELKNKTASLALSELFSYIEEFRQDETLLVFSLSDLEILYEFGIMEQDLGFSCKVNTSRFKERLITLIPDLQAQTQCHGDV